MRGKGRGRGRERQSYRARKKSARAAHKLYTVKQGKKRGHYNCCQSMHSVQECSMGPSASETKTAQSVALSPQCYHIRTSLAGKFLIYAVIFSLFFPPSSSSCRCWYRRGFNIQMPVCAGVCTCTIHTPISNPFSPPGALPRDHQQLIH